MTKQINYRGRLVVEHGRFPMTFKDGQYQVWKGHRMAGQMPTYREAKQRVEELEAQWIHELQFGSEQVS